MIRAQDIHASHIQAYRLGGAGIGPGQQAGGGGITIEVHRLIDLRKSSISSSVAQESGDAGDITIDPDFLILDDAWGLEFEVIMAAGTPEARLRAVAAHLRDMRG